MRIAIFIHTPAHAHLFRYVITHLAHKGHEIKIIARDHSFTTQLLQQFGFQYDIYTKVTNQRFLKLLQFPACLAREYRRAQSFHPDILVGIGTDEPIVGYLMRKPSIIINDTETTPYQHQINRLLASAILTPSCFLRDLGPNHIRFNGFKELAYLHPKYFQPDPKIYQELGIAHNEKYIILRFNNLEAVHDIGTSGLPLAAKYELIKRLESYGKIFISEEGRMAAGLEKYALPTLPQRIHHVLYYADLMVSDTGTMTVEAAILGTPAVTCSDDAMEIGNYAELEGKYDLLYSFTQPRGAIEKASELTRQPYLKEQWANKREKLLAEKIDVTQFLADFIENYPTSFAKYKGQA